MTSDFIFMMHVLTCPVICKSLRNDEAEKELERALQCWGIPALQSLLLAGQPSKEHGMNTPNINK